MPNISFWKDIAALTQSLFTILAISVGAFLYFKRRRRFPRAKITYQIVDKRISNNKILLRVVITVANQGEVLLSLESGFAGVQQVAPCPEALIESLKETDDIVKEGKHEAEWDTLVEKKIVFTRNEREIEPGEEEDFNFDFLIDADVRTVIIYSYFKNESKKRHGIGWNKTSIYDVSSSCDQESEGMILSQDKRWTPPAPKPIPGREDRQGPPRERPEPREKPQTPPSNPPPQKRG
jgi:hypothetical protein